jgi:2-alkyl-3-oxoalkanoate reductase
MTQILVTGASGFIGGRVVERLSQNPDFQITATGRTVQNKFSMYKNVQYIQLDLSEPLPHLLFDTCIHCAGLADDASSETALHYANVLATQNLIKSLNGCKVIIFISSASVYDFSDQLTKVETDTNISSPISAYGKSKLAAEHTLVHCPIPSKYVLRPRAVYGRGDQHLLSRICKLIKLNRLFLPGKLDVYASLTHIENLNDAILAALEQSRLGLHTYNISDAQVYQMRNVFEVIADWHTSGDLKSVHIVPAVCLRIAICLSSLAASLFGVKPLLTRQSLGYLQSDSVLNTTKAQRELGLTLHYAFDKQSLFE